MTTLSKLLAEVRACTLCEPTLPFGARPVLQAHRSARILIAGQAPGRLVHESGVPWQDPSGERLRKWLAIDETRFYDPRLVALLPMGFCYPGSGPTGDAPPRPECAATWRERLLKQLGAVELTLVLGRYAQDYHLGKGSGTVTAAVAGWREQWPAILPLPHPSPRNRAWFKRNPWFETEVLPALRRRVRELLN